MKIGFDAKKITRNLTGIGNYSRGVVEALQAAFPGNEYLLYSPTERDSEAKWRLKLSGSARFVYPRGPLWRAMRELWRVRGVVGQAESDGIDIFHGLSNEIPFGISAAPCRTVVTIHDLIFLRLPATYAPMQRRLLAVKTRYACRHADLIVAISERTRRDIVELYGIDERKIRVVYQGCDPAFRQKASAGEIARVRQKYGLSRPYLLSVGTFEPRKNQLLAVESMPSVPDGTDLVLVGRPTPHKRRVEERVEELGLRQRVRLLSNVPQAELPALYQGAGAFLYPSRYEGFGIPVLEALCSGVPVVAASGSCLEEVGGECALYCSPDSAESLARQINRLLRNPGEAAERAAAGLRRAEMFTPRRIAEAMMEVYGELMAMGKKTE